ncbi:hypothetical protein AJ80_08734 [Polytolypa hystricis UAMH7299]|uniref:Glucose-methanol-choline oxidoreductase N-terminal domain-containing protein n=1 Tax=Polytolypa hystricis (strain UAMH7299) TaxID=1447883 RepID=A0A2B7X2M5_POLH7|nr:hypothetical protein AJ80_08734 [Polytolypa hystricis UAMH7299]
MVDTADFIIVGGGTADLLLASRLANDLPDHSVLVLESGPSHPDNTHLCQYDRYQAIYRPDLDYGYVSTPQPLLNDRQILYFRGKGLGGSSNINFMAYLYGSAEDYNHWADIVGDESWCWDHSTKRRFKEIETYHMNMTGELVEYADPKPDDHGHNGPVDISLLVQLENGVPCLFDVAVEYGMSPNPDLNSGNPMGIGVSPSTFFEGYRTTSEKVSTGRTTDNLKIFTDARITKILFDRSRAHAVETRDGRQLVAKKEVILCAGSLDTPKLLLLSGVGQSEELTTHGIKPAHHLPGVGKNLADHVHVILGAEFTAGICLDDRNKFEADSAAVQATRDVWAIDGSGLVGLHNSNFLAAWLNLPGLYETEEFKGLDGAWQEFLMREAVPHYELGIGGPRIPPTYVIPDGTSYFPLALFGMNMQSRGEVKLQSGNPDDHPLIDLNYLSHPFDLRVMTDSIREGMKFLETAPGLGSQFTRYILSPKKQAFIREQLLPVFHANGTAKMGKPDDLQACVDTSFRVYGLENLRIADLSVCPLTPK